MSYQQFKRGESLKVIGPYGSAAEGNSFDHGIHSAVRQLVMGSIPPIGISFIQIQYYDDDNGTSSWTDKHGISESSLYNSNTETTTIKLDYPDEFLTSVYGYYDKPGLKQNYICSLTFKSNKRTYGPFGEERGNYFSTKVNGAMIVGFHGRSGIHGLLAIGVYMKPLNPYRPPKSLLPPAGHSLQIKLEKDDHNTKKQAPNIVVSNNQVCGNEGDRNGTFAVGFELAIKNLVSKPASGLDQRIYYQHGGSLQIKLKKDEDKNTTEHSTCVVSDYQISGNHGDDNGRFSVGNRIKYVVNQNN